jgi:hypothetical protein
MKILGRLERIAKAAVWFCCIWLCDGYVISRVGLRLLLDAEARGAGVTRGR